MIEFKRDKYGDVTVTIGGPCGSATLELTETIEEHTWDCFLSHLSPNELVTISEGQTNREPFASQG